MTVSKIEEFIAALERLRGDILCDADTAKYPETEMRLINALDYLSLARTQLKAAKMCRAENR